MSTPRETQQLLSLAALSVMSNLRDISREGLESVAKQAVTLLPGQINSVKNILCSMGEGGVSASLVVPVAATAEDHHLAPAPALTAAPSSSLRRP